MHLVTSAQMRSQSACSKLQGNRGARTDTRTDATKCIISRLRNALRSIMNE